MLATGFSHEPQTCTSDGLEAQVLGKLGEGPVLHALARVANIGPQGKPKAGSGAIISSRQATTLGHVLPGIKVGDTYTSTYTQERGKARKTSDFVISSIDAQPVAGHGVNKDQLLTLTNEGHYSQTLVLHLLLHQLTCS